ncbi:MAG: hypothetical protein R6V76_07280 [Desulfobacterales bacterium]
MEVERARYLKGASKIEEVIQNGISLDSKVLHYIDSTFSNPSKEEIGNILNGEADFEKETLLKLIFFPDESTQFFLEEFLEEVDFTKEDVEKISGYLSERKMQSKIIFPDERGTVGVQMPSVLLCEFIDCLNIAVKLHGKLAESVKFITSDRSRTLAKVRIRNARKDFEGKSLDFLSLFFEKMGYEEESIFDDCLKAVLKILDETDDRSDIYNALSIRKAACFKRLTDAERFEEQLQKNNIETLLLQGVRPLSVDKDAEMKQMEIIDRICLAVFGTTEYYEKNLMVSIRCSMPA